MGKRTFTATFKLGLVRQLLSGEQRLSHLCREHSLHANVLRRWKELYQQNGETASDKGADRKPAAVPADCPRVQELEAALGRAHLETEFLQRAVAKKGIPSKSGGRS